MVGPRGAPPPLGTPTQEGRLGMKWLLKGEAATVRWERNEGGNNLPRALLERV
jgi:hypothetical protein